MKKNFNTTKPAATAWRTGCFAVILLCCVSATAWAQQSAEPLQTAYESALLDSLLLYEYLKPVHANLLKTYGHLREENDALRNELRIERLLRMLEKQGYQYALQNEEKKRKRALWRGRIEGFTAGLLVPTPF